MAEAFVYCWTDHKTNKLYIGSHKGSIDDGYICSSDFMLSEYKKRPNDFTRQIVAEGNTEDIRKFEYKILTSANAACDENFYNKHNGFGSYLTDDVKKKIGNKSKELWSDMSFRKKMSEFHKQRHKHISEENKNKWKKKISKSNSKPKTEQAKQKMRGIRPHVNQSGHMNNNAKKIKTPFGIFGSIRDASISLCLPYNQVYYKLTCKKDGWEYLI